MKKKILIELREQVKAIVCEKPHHKYSHWEDKQPEEVLDEVIALIDKYIEETK